MRKQKIQYKIAANNLLWYMDGMYLISKIRQEYGLYHAATVAAETPSARGVQ